MKFPKRCTVNHSQITLYSARGSNSSQRVEWALNYKNIDYQRVEVLSEELTSSYLEINPFGYVPALVMGELLVTESMAIAEYLEERFTGTSLLGHSIEERANIRRVCEFVNSTIHSPQNRTVLRFLRPELEESAKKELRGSWVHQCLLKLEPTVCLSSRFAVGDHFSLADIFIASIYKKLLQHGAKPIDFYNEHLQYLRSHSSIADAEPL